MPLENYTKCVLKDAGGRGGHCTTSNRRRRSKGEGWGMLGTARLEQRSQRSAWGADLALKETNRGLALRRGAEESLAPGSAPHSRVLRGREVVGRRRGFGMLSCLSNPLRASWRVSVFGAKERVKTH